jgi:integrase
MPGKSRSPVLASWQELQGAVENADPFLWPALSRFAHWASDNGWTPTEVGAPHFERFRVEMERRCLGAKADKVVHQTAKAWAAATSAVPDAGLGDLGYVPQRQPNVKLSWSAFPPTLEADAQAFVARGDGDWLTEDIRKPLKPATRASYLDAIRRIAAILVAEGTSPETLATLADLATPARSEQVVRHMYARNGRQKGGSIQLLALLLFMIGRDHCKITGEPLERLEKLWRKTHAGGVTMSERTKNRLIQFDDDALLDRLVQLPEQLMALADQTKVVDVRSAKLARAVLYLSLLLETCARSGNTVGLDLDRHIIQSGTGKRLSVQIVVPPEETKNGSEIRAALSPLTARMLQHYVARYRPVHCGDSASTWLFPRRDGSRWAVTQACEDVKDLVARYVGADVTPHLMRSLGGKLLLDEQPGAIATVQHLLGHKSIQITIGFYTHLDPQRARAAYQAVLAERRDGDRL